MEKQDVLNAIKLSRELSKKRKFDQSFEFTINFKGIDFKKPENRIDLEVRMPFATGKQAAVKTLAFIKDKNFAEEVKGKVDRIIMDSDIPNLKKKEVDQLMADYNIFMAEGTSMLTVGKYLGQMLAPKGRMPKPIQANVQALEQAIKSSNAVVRVTNKKGKFMPVVHTVVGKESFKDEEVAANILEVYSAIINALPNKEANIKSMIIKLSMGKPVRIGQKYNQVSGVAK
jgi:large subunit ribosomal protein L1